MISAFRKGEIMHCVGTHVRTGSLRDTWDSLELLGFNVSIPILHPHFLSQTIPCSTLRVVVISLAREQVFLSILLRDVFDENIVAKREKLLNVCTF